MLTLLNAFAYIDNNIQQRINAFLGRKTSSHPLESINPHQYLARRYLSMRYLRGNGLEIGALHEPLPLYFGSKAKFLDRLDVQQLRQQYPELSNFELVEPDIIDNGETLTKIENHSLDFLISNHFIEHCENPISAIEVHLSKLKVGGILYMAVPDKDHTFDRQRPLTTIEHLMSDYLNTSTIDNRQHYREWAKFAGCVPDDCIEAEILRLMNEDYSIHFHAWDVKSFDEFIDYLLNHLHFPFEILTKVEWDFNPFETIYVLRKVDTE